MKIGLSYSRCVRDIVDGTVDIEDVLLIIARTDFDPHDDDQWNHGGHVTANAAPRRRLAPLRRAGG